MAETVIQLPPKPSASGLPPGTRLSDTYELESMLAAGGMGEVYKGRQIETGDLVAIKMIKPEFAGSEAILALFRREASALHSLYHDSIVRYFVFSVDRKLERPYLAMEFVDGPSLSDLIKTAPLTYEQVTTLRQRIASGLQVAHDKGVIHRDVSPDNIILPGGDLAQAKIIDFGIARTAGIGGHATVIGDGFAGKYNYVSPEQLGLFNGNVTNRSDIYSFGLVLAEAMMGRAIDMSGSQADVIQKRQKVPDLSGVDVRLRPLLTKMLQPDPKDRPASMADVAAWAAASSLPTAKIAAGVGLVLVLCLGGAGAYLFWPAPQTVAEKKAEPRIQPPKVQQPTEVAVAPTPPATPEPSTSSASLAPPTPPSPPALPATPTTPTPSASPASPTPPATPTPTSPSSPATPTPSASTAPPAPPATPTPPTTPSASASPTPSASATPPPSATAAIPTPPPLASLTPPPSPPTPTPSASSAPSPPPPAAPTPPTPSIALVPVPTPPPSTPAPSASLAPPMIPVPSAPPPPPPDPEILRIPALSAAERTARVLQYVHNFDGGPCFYLSPTDVTERKAVVDAFGLSDQQVQQFDTDFRVVNGFAPQISSARLTPAQCPAIAFLQRLDPDPTQAIRFEVSQTNVRPGQRVQGKIEGLGDRAVAILSIGDTGRLKVLSTSVRRERGTGIVDLRLDDEDNSLPGSKLLIAVVGSKPLASLTGLATARTTAWEALPALLQEATTKRAGATATMAIPKLVRIE